MKRLLVWIRRKLFGPSISETLAKLVTEMDKADYQNWPNVQGQHLPLVEFPLEKYKKE